MREPADCVAVVVAVAVAACCMLPLHDWQQQTRTVCNVSWSARLEHRSFAPTTFIEQTALITLKIVNTLCQASSNWRPKTTATAAVQLATSVAVCYAS